VIHAHRQFCKTDQHHGLIDEQRVLGWINTVTFV